MASTKHVYCEGDMKSLISHLYFTLFSFVCMFITTIGRFNTGHTIFNGSIFVEAENKGAPKAVQLRAIFIFRGLYSVNIHMTFPYGNNKTCIR